MSSIKKRSTRVAATFKRKKTILSWRGKGEDKKMLYFFTKGNRHNRKGDLEPILSNLTSASTREFYK